MKAKRIFLIVLDSFGIGAMPDAAAFGDEGSNTLAAVAGTGRLHVPNMAKLGLFHIDGTEAAARLMEDFGEKVRMDRADGTYARLAEASKGKDTTTGHWEIAGLVSEKPMPVFPDGFPPEVIEPFMKATGRGVLCNRPYSGTQVIRDYGVEHMETGNLIVYTSADSVFQIAAHESVVPPETLYEYCKEARKILTGPYAVGRVIARPFEGTSPKNFRRTSRRHDFSLRPPGETMLDMLSVYGLDVIGVGKISDIFAGRGLTQSFRTTDNIDGMDKTSMIARMDFTGLCFVNLVDFDMLYGHRNDAAGYADALSAFDWWLGGFITRMRKDDILMITADHGCDPSTPSTDHSREYVPLLICGDRIEKGRNLGTWSSFAAVSEIILNYFFRRNEW